MTFSTKSAAFLEGYRAAINPNVDRSANNYGRNVRNSNGACQAFIIELASAWEAGFIHGGGPKKLGETYDTATGLWCA